MIKIQEQAVELTEEEIKQQKKKEKLEREREQIMNAICNHELSNKQQKVAWLLNFFPDTRNSDTALQLKYWENFQPNFYNGGPSISIENYKKAEKLNILSRYRAVIQNDHNLFLADEEIRKYRGKLNNETRDAVAAVKTPQHSYNVFADESGKTQNYLIVGSLWILNGVGTISFNREIQAFRKIHNMNKEFHFKDIKNGNLDIYMALIELLKEHATTFSFKALYIKRDGIKNIETALKEMFYHLLSLGIEHEIQTNRAPLPRNISFMKDAENEGPDKLMLAEIKEKIETLSSTKYNKELLTSDFRAPDSQSSIYLQIADLFTSSVNRLKNSPADGPKDSFAEAFLKSFGNTNKDEKLDTYGDCTAILDL